MVLAHIPKPHVAPHQKKRFGQHHKPTKHYTNTYWPYLPMFLIIVLGFVINITWDSSTHVLGSRTGITTSSLLAGTNTDRLQHSEPALALNDQLAKAAQQKANDMAVKDYWSHVTPNGTQPWQFVSDAGYNYGSAGENLAYGFNSSDAVIAGWMNSSEHRANMLNVDYHDVGFGVATAAHYQGRSNQIIIVAMYANPGAASSQNNASGEVLGDATATTAAPTTAQQVARIDVLAGGNGRLIIATLMATIALVAIALIYRHGRIWHKYLVRGEYFIIRHPVFDTLVVVITVTGLVLSRTTGFIH